MNKILDELKKYWWIGIILIGTLAATTTPPLQTWFNIKDKINSYYLTILSDGSAKVTVQNDSQTLTNADGQYLNVKGWPQFRTNITLASSGGTIPVGGALYPLIEISGMNESSNATIMLMGAMFVLNTNVGNLAWLKCDVFSQPPSTTITPGTPPAITMTDKAYLESSIMFTNWDLGVSNQTATVRGIMEPVIPSTNSIFLVITSARSYTNFAGANDRLIFRWQRQK